MKDYLICDAEPSCLDELHELENVCFSLPWTKEQLADSLPDDMHVFIVAKDEAGVIGYVGMTTVLDEGYIANVAVAPAQRRRGIGDALLDELERRAEQRELSFMTLEVRKSNAPAIALYEKHGFSPVGERKNYYRYPTENAILMTKYLK